MSDSWAATDAALRAINKLFILLHNTKPKETPKRDSPAEKAWEEELKEVRKWAISLNYRRVQLNIDQINKERKDETHRRNSLR
jgi:hypothetical protein